MAKKVASADPVGKVRKRKSAADKAADEAQSLDPTVRITVGGEGVVVREYGFFQKQRVLHHGRAFMADVEALVNGADVTDLWDDIKPLVGVHETFARYAIAESIAGSFAPNPDRPRPEDVRRAQELVERIEDPELEPLTYLWFGVAGRFFFGEISLRDRARRMRAELDGLTSSPSSAATSNSSAATPSGS